MLGTSGRTRTGTLLRARDFESRVSTNSTTLAFRYFKEIALCGISTHCDNRQKGGDYSSDQ